MLIGVEIKMIREAFDLTQEQLGKELHLTRQTISSWENGKSYPGITDILSISNKYNVSLDELMKEDIELIEHVETIDHSLNKQKNLVRDCLCRECFISISYHFLKLHACFTDLQGDCVNYRHDCIVCLIFYSTRTS